MLTIAGWLFIAEGLIDLLALLWSAPTYGSVAIQLGALGFIVVCLQLVCGIGLLGDLPWAKRLSLYFSAVMIVGGVFSVVSRFSGPVIPLVSEAIYTLAYGFQLWAVAFSR